MNSIGASNAALTPVSTCADGVLADDAVCGPPAAVDEVPDDENHPVVRGVKPGWAAPRYDPLDPLAAGR